MSSEITDGEARVLRALCASYGPLGIPALGLAKSLGISRNTVSTTALSLERKGFCTRERVGMRVYLRPTAAGLAMASMRSEPMPRTEPVRRRGPRKRSFMSSMP